MALMQNHTIRASDDDRAAAAERLGTAVRDGRLSVTEYDERLARAFAATTHGELLPLTADLPALKTDTGCGGELRNWLFTNAFFVALWAIGSIGSGQLIFFWPLFIMLASGAGVLHSHRRRSA